MNISRRKFLRNTALTAGGYAVFSKNLFAANKMHLQIGIQLYSVRDNMETDAKATLKKLSDIGFNYVEHAYYHDRKFYDIPPVDFKKMLNDLGMQLKSGHTMIEENHWDIKKNEFTDAWKYTIEDAAIAGQEYIITPWLEEKYRKNYDDLKRYLDLFNRCGELCKKSGITFGYHNHNFECSTIINGKKMYDIILKNTDPSLVAQQLDIGGMFDCCGNAAEMLSTYPNRFDLFHIRDEIKGAKKNEEGSYESTMLGQGDIEVKDFLNKAVKQHGIKHFILEPEAYNGKTALESVALDYAVIKKWGF